MAVAFINAFTKSFTKIDWESFDCCRWKNNVERKNKFMLLQRDAAYDESDEKQIAR
jgi:hypothetical protein